MMASKPSCSRGAHHLVGGSPSNDRGVRNPGSRAQPPLRALRVPEVGRSACTTLVAPPALHLDFLLIFFFFVHVVGDGLKHWTELDPQSRAKFDKTRPSLALYPAPKQQRCIRSWCRPAVHRLETQGFGPMPAWDAVAQRASLISAPTKMPFPTRAHKGRQPGKSMLVPFQRTTPSSPGST